MISGSKVRRTVGAIALVCVLGLPVWSGDNGFQPVTSEELSLTAVQQAPGAAVVTLYREESSDDNRNTRYEYIRRKILTKEGLKYADVEIPYYGAYNAIYDLKARTIHPDGKIIDFTGNTFDKTIVKSHDFKYKAKVFTLPDVTVGSIIEYHFTYALQREGPRQTAVYNTRWDMQDDLFTVRAKFWIQQYTGGERLDVFGGGSTRLYYVYSHFPRGAQPPKVKPDGTMQVELADLPALEEEEFMPPKDVVGAQVRFYYGGDAMHTADQFWKEAGKYWNKNTEQFLSHHSSIQEAANSIVNANDPPETKARKLYAAVQSLRNLNFERKRTAEEENAENIKDNQNVDDVWKHKYGDHLDLNRLYIALARAAGLQATAVRTSGRRNTIFDKSVLSLDEMPYEIVLLTLDGKEVYLDPGMKYCPFGILPWYKTATPALKLDKDGGTFIQTPAPQFMLIKRKGEFMLDPDGTLHGDLWIEFDGQTGVTAREEEWGEDDAGRAKDLEDEVKSWFPQGTTVKLTKANDWDRSEPPLALQFTVQVPGFASATGKRTFLPFSVFQGKDEHLFQHAERKWPVYMPYPYQHLDVVNIKLPPGVTVESLPKEKAESNDLERMQTIARVSGDSVHLERLVVLFDFFYPLDQYEGLRAFFERVKIADDEQIVLTKKTP